MTPFPFTFSQAERAEACPGSQALPQIPSTSVHAQMGALIHRFVIHALTLPGGREAALEREIEPVRAVLAQYDLWGLPEAQTFAHEVAFAYDPETRGARELGRDLQRDYLGAGAKVHEIVGAADFVAVDGTRVCIDDLKTGYGRLTRAADNLQLLGLAVCAAKVYDRKVARVRLLVRREDGSGYFDDATLDRFELTLAERRLQAAARAVAQARATYMADGIPRLEEGPWCDHCQARWNCPAKVTLVKTLAVAPRQIVRDVLGMMSDSDWANALERVRQAKQELHFIEEKIADFVRANGPIDLGLDEEYGPREVRTPIVDGKIAFDTLQSFLTTRGMDDREAMGVAAKAVEMKTSKAAIRRALIPHAPRGQLTGWHREVLDGITEDGGISFKTQIRVDRHPKRKGLPPAMPPTVDDEGESDGEVIT